MPLPKCAATAFYGLGAAGGELVSLKRLLSLQLTPIVDPVPSDVPHGGREQIRKGHEKAQAKGAAFSPLAVVVRAKGPFQGTASWWCQSSHAESDLIVTIFNINIKNIPMKTYKCIMGCS